MRSGRSAALDVTTYAYDASKRLTSVSSVDGTQIRYSYNAAGSIVSRVVGKVTDVVNTLDVDATARAAARRGRSDALVTTGVNVTFPRANSKATSVLGSNPAFSRMACGMVTWPLLVIFMVDLGITFSSKNLPDSPMLTRQCLIALTGLN